MYTHSVGRPYRGLYDPNAAREGLRPVNPGLAAQK